MEGKEKPEPPLGMMRVGWIPWMPALFRNLV
jgi:hypothetical protein